MTFLKTLQSNKYIVGVDFRGNKGYSDNDSVKTSVGLYLQRNLNLNLAMDVRLKDTWIIKDQIFPEIKALDGENAQLDMEINDLHNSKTARNLLKKLCKSQILGDLNIRKTNNHSPKHKHTSQDQPHHAICDLDYPIAQSSDMEINLFEKSSLENQKPSINKDISPVD